MPVAFRQRLKAKREQWGPTYPAKDWIWDNIIQIVTYLFIIVGVILLWLKSVGIDGLWTLPDRRFEIPRIILYGLIFLLGLYIARIKVKSRRAPAELESLQRIVSDSSLVINYLGEVLVHIANLDSVPSDEERSRLAVERSVDIIWNVFPTQGIRAHVLTPNGDWLEPYSHEHMPKQWGSDRKFYIGDDPKIRSGVAGLSYQNDVPIVVRMKHDGTRWNASHDEFIDFNPNNTEPMYKSFVCIRMVRSNDSTDGIGVLCIDSQHEPTFDARKLSSWLCSSAQQLQYCCSVLRIKIACGLQQTRDQTT